jgi:hypothetical protein
MFLDFILELAEVSDIDIIEVEYYDHAKDYKYAISFKKFIENIKMIEDKLMVFLETYYFELSDEEEALVKSWKTNQDKTDWFSEYFVRELHERNPEDELLDTLHKEIIKRFKEGKM